MAIAELSAIASTLNNEDKNVPEEIIPAATASFDKIISYLRKLDQIGTGIPNTTQGIPSESDVQNIVNTGLIENQLFVDSLCQLLRIQNPPRVIKLEEQEETNE